MGCRSAKDKKRRGSVTTEDPRGQGRSLRGAGAHSVEHPTVNGAGHTLSSGLEEETGGRLSLEHWAGPFRRKPPF